MHALIISRIINVIPIYKGYKVYMLLQENYTSKGHAASLYVFILLLKNLLHVHEVTERVLYTDIMQAASKHSHSSNSTSK